MTKIFSQICPLCGMPAQYYVADNRKFFECANCIRFQITTKAENFIMLFASKRNEFIFKAQAAHENESLVISVVNDEITATSYPNHLLPLGIAE